MSEGSPRKLSPRKLSLVPTPIGNLGDMTLRGLETLKAADAVAAEDTRHSRTLLAHYTIDKPLLRLDAHTVAQRAEGLLAQHAHLAFITDAGTPGISDPGAELVALALERGVEVEVLPGATAFVPALVGSGLSTARFTFEGFLPRKGGARRSRLAAIASSSATTLMYESPRRLLATLKDLSAVCGAARRASVSRELTKRFETTYRGTLASLLKDLDQGEVKGEIVIAIGPAEAQPPPDFAAQAAQLRREGLRGRELRTALSALGAPRNLAYKLALDEGRSERPE